MKELRAGRGWMQGVDRGLEGKRRVRPARAPFDARLFIIFGGRGGFPEFQLKGFPH